MRIDDCRMADIEDAVALWTTSGLTRPWNDPHADFTLALNSSGSTVLGGFDGDTLVATVMVGFDGHRGWIYYLAVAPSERGRGVGRRMMEAAENWLRTRGAPKLQLMVREDNLSASFFYERLGLERQSVAVFGKRLSAP